MNSEVNMKKISDAALKERIEKRKAELDSLLALEQERIQARRSKIGEFLESKYGLTTIPELEKLLAQLSNGKEV